jgi:uncharacterized protein
MRWPLRLAYTSDLHGNLALYQALLSVAVETNAEAVIVGGDLLPHEPRASQAIATQRSFIDTQLSPLLSAFRSAHPLITCFLLAGNDDWEAAIAGLEDLAAQRVAYPLHGRVIELAGLTIAGYACVPPTPFSMKDYERPDEGSRRGVSFGRAYVSSREGLRPLSESEFLARPTIASELAALVAQCDPARAILVCHTPPADTPLDQMRGERHVGSPGLRALIEQHQPLLTLHGHIHEAPQLSGQYVCQIGQTWCVNPGRDAVRLHAVVLDTDDIAGTLTHTIYGRP